MILVLSKMNFSYPISKVANTWGFFTLSSCELHCWST